MEKKFTLWNKRGLAIGILLFIAGGWGLLFYQEKQGTPIVSDRSNYVRLHILANSDSVQDQNVKLKVRDAVIAYLAPHVKDVTDTQAAKDIIASRQAEIIQVAQRCLQDNGFDYPVDIQIGNFEFPVKTYGNLVLPAGEYQAVRIRLGQAAGQNWWCVLFPPLCFVEGTTALASPSVANQQAEKNNPPEIRWRLAEIFK